MKQLSPPTKDWRSAELAGAIAEFRDGAWFEIEPGGATTRVKVLHSTLASGSGAPGAILDDKLTIACGDGAVRLVQVQREGKGAMDAGAFLRGAGNLPSAVR
jgi:methionyl-tRNA formyltransferase